MNDLQIKIISFRVSVAWFIFLTISAFPLAWIALFINAVPDALYVFLRQTIIPSDFGMVFIVSSAIAFYVTCIVYVAIRDFLIRQKIVRLVVILLLFTILTAIISGVVYGAIFGLIVAMFGSLVFVPLFTLYTKLMIKKTIFKKNVFRYTDIDLLSLKFLSGVLVLGLIVISLPRWLSYLQNVPKEMAVSSVDVTLCDVYDEIEKEQCVKNFVQKEYDRVVREMEKCSFSISSKPCRPELTTHIGNCLDQNRNKTDYDICLSSFEYSQPYPSAF